MNSAIIINYIIIGSNIYSSKSCYGWRKDIIFKSKNNTTRKN